MNNPSAGPISHSQRIVGGTREIRALSDWLETPEEGMKVFAVSGIGGIGKTTLLTKLAAEARGRQYVCCGWTGSSACIRQGMCWLIWT